MLHKHMLYSHNFIGGAGKNPVTGTTINQVGGKYEFSYSFLTADSHINGTHYEGGGFLTDEEEHFVDSTDSRYMQWAFEAMLEIMTVQQTWGHSFIDVANVTFVSGTATSAEILIGQVGNDSSGNLFDAFISGGQGVTAGAYTAPSYSSDEHGDIWIHADHYSSIYGGNTWHMDGSATNMIEPGEWMYTVLHEELSHSLGFDIVGSNLYGSGYDSLKYTITSYNDHPGVSYDEPGGSGPSPTGLQLLDIAALQDIYGANYSTRSSDTTYNKSGAFASAYDYEAFVYTIWDGGGVDEIDATGFTVGATIDLRQGEFSTIGYHNYWGYWGYAADENVAIAYNAIIENTTGTDESDILIGNAWDNVLNGEAGDDTLYGDGRSYDNYVGFGVDPDQYDSNNGNAAAPDFDEDEINGGSGDDTIYGGYGSDNINGGADEDTIYYNNIAAYIKVTTIDESAGDYEIRKWYAGSDPTSDPADDTDTLTSIEILDIYDSSAENGPAFQSDSYGGTAVTGDENDNSLSAGSEASTVSGLAGNDSLGGSSYNDKILGGADNDYLYGYGGNDQLLGGAGADYLDGGTGDDYLDGGEGDDYIVGGQGNDLYIYSGGNDTFYEYSGYSDDIDTIRFSGGTTLSSLSFARYGSSYDIEITIAGGGTITLAYQSHYTTNIDLLDLADGTFDMKDIQVPIYGTSAGESIYGNRSELYYGTHYYEAASIHDLVYGGGGDDSIHVSHGNNVVYGESGADYITGGNDSDLFYGGDGDDDLRGNNGNDLLYGDDGNDVLQGGYGADILYGGSGNDTIYTGYDNDLIFSGAGDDTIYSSYGADTFVFEAGGGHDTIWYFNISQNDALDLSDLLSGYDSTTDDITNFVDVSVNGSHTDIGVDTSGGGSFTTIATLYSLTGIGDAADLEASNTLITA